MATRTDRAVTPLGAEIALWRLVSPALPIGAFAWSDGLEHAVERGDVASEAGAADWIGGVLGAGPGRVDAPLLARMHRAWADGDVDSVRRWSATLVAMRDTSELRTSDRQCGQALARLLADLGEADAATWTGARHASLAALFALACVRAGASVERAVAGYLWAWLENQVAAAIKLVPLGQTAGQRVLARLSGEVEAIAARAADVEWDAVHGSVFGVSIASAAHETQYTRLFRS